MFTVKQLFYTIVC